MYLLALIYVIEALSVIAQVLYFKLTKRLEGEEKSASYPKVVITEAYKEIARGGKTAFPNGTNSSSFLRWFFRRKGVSRMASGSNVLVGSGVISHCCS